MKKNLGMFFGLSRCGVGAVLLGLCAFTPISRAAITFLDNTSDPNNGNTTTTYTYADVFTMGAAGYLNSLTLTLSGSLSSAVYVYAATSGNPPTSSYNGAGNALFSLGTVSGSSPVILSLNDYLAAGTYAIVLASSGSSWSLTASGAATTQNGSSFGGLYYNNTGTWAPTAGIGQMNLVGVTAVPEVPMTGMVMGFGALAIALGRKFRTAVSSIA
jgi:hypothetical protein